MVVATMFISIVTNKSGEKRMYRHRQFQEIVTLFKRQSAKFSYSNIHDYDSIKGRTLAEQNTVASCLRSTSESKINSKQRLY